MKTASYTFQSPYPNQIQIGKPDPNAGKEDNAQQEDANLIKKTNQTVQKAEIVQTAKTQEVQPSVKSERLLDTYA